MSAKQSFSNDECCITTSSFFLIYQGIGRVTFSLFSSWLLVHVCWTEPQCMCVTFMVTWKSIDRALAHRLVFLVCHHSYFRLTILLKYFFSSCLCLPFFLSPSLLCFALCLFLPLSLAFACTPHNHHYADPDFGIQCCYGNNVGLALSASLSYSSYSG